MDPGRHLREDTRKASRSLGVRRVISCVLGLPARAQAVGGRVWRLQEACSYNAQFQLTCGHPRSEGCHKPQMPGVCEGMGAPSRTTSRTSAPFQAQSRSRATLEVQEEVHYLRHLQLWGRRLHVLGQSSHPTMVRQLECGSKGALHIDRLGLRLFPLGSWLRYLGIGVIIPLMSSTARSVQGTDSFPQHNGEF